MKRVLWIVFGVVLIFGVAFLIYSQLNDDITLSPRSNENKYDINNLEVEIANRRVIVTNVETGKSIANFRYSPASFKNFFDKYVKGTEIRCAEALDPEVLKDSSSGEDEGETNGGNEGGDVPGTAENMEDQVCVDTAVPLDPDSPTSVVNYVTTYVPRNINSYLTPGGGCSTASVYYSLLLHFPSALSGNIEEDIQDISDAINENPEGAADLEDIESGYIEILGADNVDVEEMPFRGSSNELSNIADKLRRGCDVSISWAFDRQGVAHTETMLSVNPSAGEFQTINQLTGAVDHAGLGGTHIDVNRDRVRDTPTRARLICVCPA